MRNLLYILLLIFLFSCKKENPISDIPEIEFISISPTIVQEFSDEIKPRNFVYSIGIDFIKNCFSFEKKIFKDLRNKIITKLNKNNFIKDQFLNFADNKFKL